MSNAAEQNPPVKAKAVLIDPGSMTVLWMNESAAQDLADGDADSAAGSPVEQAVPLAETLGVPDALRAAAETGVTQHVRTDLVSTSRGRVAIVASVDRLPDGTLLLLMENAWQAGRRDAARGDETRRVS